MAKSAQIGALRITLAMNAGEFAKGAREAESRLTSLGKTAAKTAAVVAAAAAAAVSGLALAVRGMLKEADQLTKMGRAIGVPVEQLSALKHAAELSGLSVEDLGKGMKTLSRNMMAAASDARSQVALAFQAIGVSVRDASGNLRSSTDVMKDVAERFKGMEDGAGKTALAMAIFGKSGADMINMLNNGRDGLNAMMEEARKLGIVIDQQTGEAAERFNDNLDRMSKIKKGIITQVSARLAPLMEQLSERFLAAARDTDFLDRAAKFLENTLKELVATGEIVAAIFKTIGTVVSAVAQAVMNVAKGEFSEAWEVLKGGALDVKTIFDDTRRSLSSLYDGWHATVQKIATDAPKVAAPIITSTRAIAEAEREVNKARADAERLMKSLEEPQERLNRLMEEATILYAKGALTASEYGLAMERMSAQAANAMKANVGSAVTAVTGSLSALWSKSKKFAIADALANTYVAFNRALANPPGPPFSYVQAAAALASGMAQVRAIQSTNPGSSGGGGGGGAASAPAAAAAPPTQAIHISGVDRGHFYSGAMIENLMNAINEQTMNGRVLISTRNIAA
jgi:hypothetical protein